MIEHSRLSQFRVLCQIRAIAARGVVRLAVSLTGLILVAGGCGHSPIAPSDDPTGVPFGLVISPPPVGYDYYVHVGTKGEEQVSYVDTTEYPVTVWEFAAQFVADSGGSVPYDVWINFTKLKRHHEGDTLRLSSGGLDSTILRDDQTWRIIDTAKPDFDLTRFVVPAVTLLDTIGPFEAKKQTRGTIRSDTALTITWRPGETGGNIRLEWRAPKTTVVRDARDFEGQISLPAPVMENLIGEGKVIVTRYRSITHNFEGKSIYAQRLSQRIYTAIVQ